MALLAQLFLEAFITFPFHQAIYVMNGLSPRGIRLPPVRSLAPNLIILFTLYASLSCLRSRRYPAFSSSDHPVFVPASILLSYLIV